MSGLFQRVIAIVVTLQSLSIIYLLINSSRPLYDQPPPTVRVNKKPPAPSTVTYPRNAATPVIPAGLLKKHQQESSEITELCRLGKKYGADKSPLTPGQRHKYTPLYHRILKDRRTNVRKLAEIGIGYKELMAAYTEHAWTPGASGKMWRDYFPNARVYLMDLRTKNFFNDTRISCVWTDQGQPNQLRESMYEISRLDPEPKELFDVIIDDGSHWLAHMVLSLGTLWPYVKEGGVYIVEDINGGKDTIEALTDLDLWYNRNPDKIMYDRWVVEALRDARLNSDVMIWDEWDWNGFIAYFKHYKDPPPEEGNKQQ